MGGILAGTEHRDAVSREGPHGEATRMHKERMSGVEKGRSYC